MINIALLVGAMLLFVIGYFEVSAGHAMQVGFRVLFLALILYAVGVWLHRWKKGEKLPLSQVSFYPRRLRRFIVDEEDEDRPSDRQD